MNDSPSDRGRRRRTPTTSVFVALALFSAFFTTGCISYQRQGDRAFERSDCNEALAAYERAIDTSDPKDWQMYFRAAQCALRMGDFAATERYFSKSLRYGGGLDVARELAAFYVKTSNYISAVRVYQYLLYQEEDKQSVYNNLGTALMYAGQYFDAESYLLVAQQMSPKKALPYVNLGVLYDRHMRQPWLAINFYDCYVRMAPRAKNVEMVSQRAEQLRSRYARMYEPEVLECGEPYQPQLANQPVTDLKRVVDLDIDEPNGEEEPAEPATVEDVGATADESRDPDEPVREIPINRVVTEADLPAESTPSGELALARAAYRASRWAAAVDHFTQVPVASLSQSDQKMLGMSYLKQANWTLAAHWLGLASVSQSDPELVGGLARAYSKLRKADRLAELCKEFGKRPKYEKIASEYCRGDGNE